MLRKLIITFNIFFFPSFTNWTAFLFGHRAKILEPDLLIDWFLTVCHPIQALLMPKIREQGSLFINNCILCTQSNRINIVLFLFLFWSIWPYMPLWHVQVLRLEDQGIKGFFINPNDPEFNIIPSTLFLGEVLILCREFSQRILRSTDRVR